MRDDGEHVGAGLEALDDHDADGVFRLVDQKLRGPHVFLLETAWSLDDGQDAVFYKTEDCRVNREDPPLATRRGVVARGAAQAARLSDFVPSTGRSGMC